MLLIIDLFTCVSIHIHFYSFTHAGARVLLRVYPYGVRDTDNALFYVYSLVLTICRLYPLDIIYSNEAYIVIISVEFTMSS